MNKEQMKEMVRTEYVIELRAEEVRDLCIRLNFYTRGDCKAYDKMLNRCGYITADELIEIASDIVEHSDCDNNEWLAPYQPLDEVICYLQDICHVKVVQKSIHNNPRVGGITRVVKQKRK